LRRVKAGAGKFEYAAELKVVANNLSEEGSVRFGGVGARAEVGEGHTGFYLTEPRSGADPVLGYG